MIFRIAHGGHLGNWRSYWNDLNTQMVCVSLNLLSLCWNTSHIIPNNHFNPLLPFWGKIVLHDCPWRPSWKLAAILKRSKLSYSSYDINCTFYMLKTHIVLSKWSFSAICCNFLAKKRISGLPMATILKNGHIEILRGPRYFPAGWSL